MPTPITLGNLFLWTLSSPLSLKARSHTRSERPLRLGINATGWNDELPRQWSAKRPCHWQCKELSRIKRFATNRETTINNQSRLDESSAVRALQAGCGFCYLLKKRNGGGDHRHGLHGGSSSFHVESNIRLPVLVTCRNDNTAHPRRQDSSTQGGTVETAKTLGPLCLFTSTQRSFLVI